MSSDDMLSDEMLMEMLQRAYSTLLHTTERIKRELEKLMDEGTLKGTNPPDWW